MGGVRPQLKGKARAHSFIISVVVFVWGGGDVGNEVGTVSSES